MLAKLAAAGAEYYFPPEKLEGPEDEMIPARLVSDWSASAESVDLFLEHLRG